MTKKKHKKKLEVKEKKKAITIWFEKWQNYLFPSFLFLIVFFLNLPLAKLQLMSPDASGYLDMGKNLFTGKGAISSFNLYQFWNGKYHPFLPYMQPIYPIVAGLIWILLNLKAVIGFNILLLGINCIFLYKIFRIKTDYITSFFITLFFVFSQILVLPSIFPWTEHLHLFFLLSIIFLYLRYEKSKFFIGILLGLSCLIRTASFYNVFAFGIALILLNGFSKKSFKEYGTILSGFLISYGLYEIFCYFKYKSFYPEYLICAKTYRAAEIYEGAFYKNSFPVLNMPSLKIEKQIIYANTKKHFIDFIKNFGYMKFVLGIAPLYFIYDIWKKKTHLVSIFFLQGIFVILGYTLSLYWLPEIESTRYSLIPFITLVSIGLISIREILIPLIFKKVKKLFSIIFVLFILPFLCLNIKQYFSFRNFYQNIYSPVYIRQIDPYRKERFEMYEWIKTNTEKDVLIASDFLRDAFLFERPFVSLPSGKALNVKNMIDFLKIYSPDYILTYNESLINFLKSIGFKEKKIITPFILLSKK